MKTDNSNIVHESFEDYLIRNPYQDTRSFTKEDWELNMYEKWSEENGINTIINADNNIVVQESLEDAARKYEKEDNTFDWIEDNVGYIANKSFRDGANWHKEQLQPLLESHAELIEALKPLANMFDDWFKTYPMRKNMDGVLYGYNKHEITYEIMRKAITAIEKANNINH